MNAAASAKDTAGERSSGGKFRTHRIMRPTSGNEMARYRNSGTPATATSVIRENRDAARGLLIACLSG